MFCRLIFALRFPVQECTQRSLFVELLRGLAMEEWKLSVLRLDFSMVLWKKKPLLSLVCFNDGFLGF